MGGRAGLADSGGRASGEGDCRAGGRSSYFGRLHVLKGVDLEVRRGETVCIIGPSGSGKSTFLRCVNHLSGSTAGASRSTAI